MRPMLGKPFHRPGWIYEEKYDGWRMLAFKDGPRVRLISRRLLLSAISVVKQEKRRRSALFHELTWWAEQGSNLRPQPCKGRALPAELSARV